MRMMETRWRRGVQGFGEDTLPNSQVTNRHAVQAHPDSGDGGVWEVGKGELRASSFLGRLG